MENNTSSDFNIKQLSQISDSYKALVQKKYSFETDDSNGWGEVLLRRLASFKEKGFPQFGGFVLAGPVGSGRHNAAGFVVYSLMESGYTPFLVRVQECGETAAEQLASAIEQTAREREGGTCLVADLTDCQDECDAQISTIMAAAEKLFLAALNDESFPKFFVMVLADRLHAIPPILREQLTLCRLTLPGLSERSAFIENNSHILPDADWAERLAELTEGADYSELRDLCRNIDDIYVTADELSDSETIISALGLDAAFRKDVPEKIPVPEPPEPPKPLADKILERVDRVIELLPTIADIFASRAVQPAFIPAVQGAGNINGGILTPDLTNVELPDDEITDNDSNIDLKDVNEKDVEFRDFNPDEATQSVVNKSPQQLLNNFFSDEEREQLALTDS